MEMFKEYAHFEERVLSLHPEDVPKPRISRSKINQQILQSLPSQLWVLKVVAVLYDICKGKLNSDFILTKLHASISRKSLYYLYVENDKIVAFCILGRESRQEFQQFVGIRQFKQHLQEQQKPVPDLLRIIQGRDFVAYSIAILCSCKKGAGRRLVDAIPSSIRQPSFLLTVDSPLQTLRGYYQSLGFVYEKDVYEWSGTIYKVIQK